MYSPLPAPTVSSKLRMPTIGFPPYRYVPGIFPHPLKDVNGHSYQRKEEFPWVSNLPWQKDQLWLRGMDLFDYRFYWEAHELWEAGWKQCSGIEKILLQGMILSSAALLQRHMGRDRIARNSWIKSKSALVQALSNRHTRGVLIQEFIDEMERELPSGGWPLIKNEAL